MKDTDQRSERRRRFHLDLRVRERDRDTQRHGPRHHDDDAQNDHDPRQERQGGCQDGRRKRSGDLSDRRSDQTVHGSSAAAFLPAKPVKVGDTWDLDLGANATKDQNVKGKVTLVSIDTVKGVKVAKFKTVSDVTASDGHENAHGSDHSDRYRDRQAPEPPPKRQETAAAAKSTSKWN